MALAGNIKEFGLADIFQIISLQQKTGDLMVKGADGDVTILVEKGLIVGADATFRPIETRLQQSLVRSQSISKFQLKRATETQKKTHQPLWSILAEGGAVEINLLKNMLSQQIHETVYHVLRWSDGEFRFEPKKSVEYDTQFISPINTEFLVMEGFRITDEWSEIEEKITSFQLVIRRKPGPPVSPDALSDAESKVYKLLTSELTIQDVIDTSQLGEFDTCQMIYELMKKNLVESVQTKKGKAPKIRRVSISITDVLTRAVAVVVAVVLLVGVVLSFRYLPEHLAIIHKPGLGKALNVKRFAAQSQLKNFSMMILRYFLEHKKPPKSFDELEKQGFIQSARMIKDPWGNDYVLNLKQAQVIVRSPGNDGILETDDDIHATIPF